MAAAASQNKNKKSQQTASKSSTRLQVKNVPTGDVNGKPKVILLWNSIWNFKYWEVLVTHKKIFSFIVSMFDSLNDHI